MATEETSSNASYKHQWARYVAQQTLKDDLASARNRVQEAVSQSENLLITVDGKESVSKLLEKTGEFTGLGFVPPEQGKFKVGIVGAGVAGLFTAMVFDWLNEKVEGLNVDYDIIEAAGEKRLGGRLYTHEFSEKEHDYYDVGAMRFPNNHIMKRTFRLFDLIGLKKGKGGLIPYYFPPDDDKVCPSYFNDISRVGNVWPEVEEDKPKVEGVGDPFNINSGLPTNAQVDKDVLAKSPSDVVAAALKDFIEDTKEKFKKTRDEIAKGEGEIKATELWTHLMKFDNMSVRQFLSSKDNGPGMTKGPGYNYNTIEWLETVTYGTGWYDQSLTECVLEELDFAIPKEEEGEPKHNYWYCIDGGAQKVARLMAEKIKKPVQLNSQVLSINANARDRIDPKAYVRMTLEINRTDPESKKTDIRHEDYFAVLNSTTLPALQRMNLKDAGLLWGTKQAIRALGYGASCKVAIKFKKPWWQLEPFNINNGGVSRTDLPLRVCVYPSYNTREAEGEEWNRESSSVLLCSYTWGQDAQRLGSLISPDTPDNEEQLVSVLLHNLALLHANETKKYEDLLCELKELYETHHAWDWYRDQNMSGAFAYFGPGQFSNMWQEITKPNAFGQLYLIGEAASSHHAWIVGALESVIRAVYFMFQGLNSNDPEYQPYSDVIDLLSKAQDVPDDPASWELPRGLPFHPLPEEMPERQFYTKRKAKQTNDPAVRDLPLTYPAAVASLSLVESYFELVYSAQAAAQTS
ncbi:hypothetical protein G7Z17_g9284 [Cylindrodendrum hubeiense]|uniref:Amine oxidase domain-containing protein n=1 Tax=Cylindrodendrum hubeiense TaxID=595255 RepID=A0A9P5LDH8_9HYPO|nr:hypothetical protein G7Z17_g9284 [Cylindrodendrum hubeiense]